MTDSSSRLPPSAPKLLLLNRLPRKPINRSGGHGESSPHGRNVLGREGKHSSPGRVDLIPVPVGGHDAVRGMRIGALQQMTDLVGHGASQEFRGIHMGVAHL